MQFKTTLLARRFPGLRDLPDRDIRDLILADRRAAGRRLMAPVKSHPKTHFKPLPPKREQWPAATQAPFTYINPMQAKSDIRRPDSEVIMACMGCPLLLSSCGKHPGVMN